jgi:poly-gamma-glutamate capsule biosynthesis protein CapA/YwtB (metallophosphatase superfamily)
MTFTLALTGDAMVTRGALVSADPRAHQLRDLLHAADVSFTNLEAVTSDLDGYHSSGAFTPTLIAPAAVLDELVDIGIDVVSFANNHTLNLGIDGMLDAVRELRARRIPYAGVGSTLAEASRPAYVDTPGGSVAVIACTTTFTSGDEATRPSDTMRGRPGLNPMRHRARIGVTEGQLSALQEAHRQVGLEAQVDYLRDMRFLPPADGTNHLLFGSTFFAADQPHIETRCVPGDLERICRWVGEAKARAGVAVVSVHSHECGADLERPADFLVEFAHAVIDAGADVVVGHGPHRVRGIELYRGRPIFYSLGNFVGQFELLTTLSSHSYDVLGADDSAAPHQVVGGTSLGFADHPEYWRAVVPVLTFDGGALAGIDLHPTSLDHELPVHERGRPRLATGAEAEAVLADLRSLSEPFGTRISGDASSARVELTGAQPA